MDLTPSDLGGSFGLALLERRAGKKPGDAPEPLGRFGQAWTRGHDLSEIERRTLLSGRSRALPATIAGGLMVTACATIPGFIDGLTRGNWIEAGLSGAAAIGATVYSIWHAPRHLMNRLARRPVSVDELEALRRPVGGRNPSLPEQVISVLLGHPLPPPPTVDPVENAFLDLARDLLALDLAGESASSLRTTLKALGDAVAALPEPAAVDPTAIADLVTDAETLLIRARRETDTVVAESLQRQAEATVRRARALQDATKIARRTKVLRSEVKAQIDAMRAALPSFSRASQAPLDTRFADLAESVSSVAREARSVLAAHEELANIAAPYRTSAAQPQTQQQRLGG